MYEELLLSLISDNKLTYKSCGMINICGLAAYAPCPSSSTLENIIMAKQTRTFVNQQNNPTITERGVFNLEQREAIIREAAYHYYAKRGYTHGHDIEDWLLAEVELENNTSESQEFPSDTEMQQSSVQGAGKDEKMKKIIKRHPQKAIPQIESTEPENTPSRE